MPDGSPALSDVETEPAQGSAAGELRCRGLLPTCNPIPWGRVIQTNLPGPHYCGKVLKDRDVPMVAGGRGDESSMAWA